MHRAGSDDRDEHARAACFVVNVQTGLPLVILRLIATGLVMTMICVVRMDIGQVKMDAVMNMVVVAMLMSVDCRPRERANR